jgi:putative DNA primase/helicase
MTEPEGNKRLSPAKVKFLTSGTDKISGRNLNERQVIEFDPTHTLLMHGNTVPRVIGHQGPFYDRLRLLPFRARFIRDQGEVDPEKFVFLQIPEYQLTKTMHEHDSEMLSFLVRCARKALEAGDMPAPPEAVLKETADFRDEEDLVGRYLKQCTEIVPDGMEQAKDIYLSFAWWCKEELGLTAKSTPSQKAISSDLRAQPHIEREPGRVNKYRGIQVRKEWIPPKED